MGDLAVPILTKWASEGNEWAIDALHTIETPQAACALVPLLWDKTKTLRYQSAWRLSALLLKPNVEAALNDFPMTLEQHNSDTVNWIWSPFTTIQNSTLSVITGRIAYLLKTSPSTEIPSGILTLDPRLAIPLCAIATHELKL